MTANTPRYGWPYPVGTDRVRDGDNAIQALAEAVETTVKAADMTPFGSVYATDQGPGVGGTMWFLTSPIVMAGGCVGVTDGLRNGIKVPRAGWYKLHAVANMQCGSAAAGMSARLFIGDGAGTWCQGQVPFVAINVDHEVSCMTVQQLGAGTNVFMGMNSIGPQSAGIYGPWNRNTLTVQMVAPL